MNQLATRNQEMLADIKGTQEVCRQLMQTPHYKKLGEEGVFAVVEKAKSIGVSPLDALNGGMYFVKGKVELSSGMMNQLIRAQKHSITKDRKSDNTICILHGRRADNGDTWTESFSIEDAKTAGIYGNQWLKYPKDMLFARALSRLARQLFPDVIKGCYVQGEIRDSVILEREEAREIMQEPEIEVLDKQEVSDEEISLLLNYLDSDLELKTNIVNFMKRELQTEDFAALPRKMYIAFRAKAKKRAEEREETESEAV